MREKIFAKTKLTASAGIAPNTFLAKVTALSFTEHKEVMLTFVVL